MEISVGLALILAFFAGFSYFARRFLGDLFLERAIVLGPLTGLIMGDIQTGLLIGGTLELIFMGAADIGGAVPPNLPIGSVLGTAFAISFGLSLEEALLIAIPAALVGSLGELLAKTLSTFFVAGAERYADQGSGRGVALMVHLGNLFHFLAVAVPAFIGLTLGARAVDVLSGAIPEGFQTGIKVAGSVLPALGFGILLSTLVTPALFPFFFLGFVLAAYAQFGVLGSAFVGLLIGTIVVYARGGLRLTRPVAEAEAAAEAMVPREEQRRIFWRSFALQSAFSFDRMQSLGFTWTLLPFLTKLHGKTEEFKRALKRHITFFNTHPWIVGPILAMVADLEARRAKNPEEVEEKDMQAVKASLMGPIAGVGDSAFHATVRPLAGGIASSMALQGNPIAPLFFFFATNIVHVWARWTSQSWGFRMGSRLFEQLDREGLQRLMEGAAMAGLMGLGALVGTWLNIRTPLAYTVQDATVSVQAMLDSIMPRLLPLLTTLGVYWAVRRGIHYVTIMLILAIGGFVLGWLKILG